ncbi:MAG: YCF48-related protein [Bacteroidota bacterium]
MKKAICIIIVFTTLLSNEIVSQEGWFWQNPLPQGNTLYDICRNDLNGNYYACGVYGTILIQSIGNIWTPINANTEEILHSICFKGTHGWAVGYNGTIMHSADGAGVAWLPQESGTDKYLKSIFFLDGQNGWIVGSERTILHTSDGGQNWEVQATGGSTHLNSIFFHDESTGYVCGINGAILKTTNGGSFWMGQNTPTHYDLNSIHFKDINNGVAVGERGTVLYTTDAGLNWILVDSLTESNLMDAYFDGDNGYAVGNDGVIAHTNDFGQNWDVQYTDTENILYAISGNKIVGQSGIIMRSTSNGQAWEFESSGFYDNLLGVDFVDENNGWVVGLNGAIYQTVDGGDNWIKHDSIRNWTKQDSLAAYDLLAVDFITPNAGFAVGEVGTILKYRNSFGLSIWVDKSISTTSDLRAVHRRFAGRAWIAGEFGSIWKTKDYGETWQIQHQNSGYHLNAIHFVSKNYGWAAGMSGAVLKTTDGGENWVDIFPDNLSYFNSIYFVDYKHGWVVGVNGIAYRTTDGGSTWIETSLPIGNAKSVCFVDENRGWIAGSHGEIIYSYDGGETWYSQNSGCINNLNSMSFTDNGTGWIAGSDGVILKTVDGGGEFIVSTYRRFALNFEIPDLGVASDILDVEASPKLLKVLEDNVVSGVTVMLDSVIHSHVADLTLLLSHEGITDTLIYQAGEEEADIINCNLSDASTTVIDEGEAPFSGTYKPHSPLSVFNGVNPIGEWTLSIYDDIEGNTGTLQAWGLKLYFDKVTNISCPEPILPSEYKLYQNYPNPFNPSTTIKYQIPANVRRETSNVKLVVFDILGREVATLVDEKQKAGTYEVKWNPFNLSSGVYIYRLCAGSFMESKKLLFIK